MHIGIYAISLQHDVHQIMPPSLASAYIRSTHSYFRNSHLPLALLGLRCNLYSHGHLHRVRYNAQARRHGGLFLDQHVS
jgi:hypothetical protein